MSRSGTPLSTPTKDIGIPDQDPTKYEIRKAPPIPPRTLISFGDSHGNFLVVIRRLRMFNIIDISEQDHDQLVRIMDNLKQLQPIANIMKIISTSFENLTKDDFEKLVLELQFLSSHIDGLDKYIYNIIKAVYAASSESSGESFSSDEETSEESVMDSEEFVNAIKGLGDKLWADMMKLKPVMKNDMSIFREIMDRVKVVDKKTPILDNGDGTADRVGCDVHNMFLRKALIRGGLNFVGEIQSNHAVEFYYMLKFNSRLKKLNVGPESIGAFISPLSNEDLLNLPADDYTASLLNLVRFLQWGFVSYKDVNSLFEKYFEPHQRIMLTVRDKNNNEAITHFQHAPVKRDVELKHPVFLAVLAFLDVKCKNYDNIKERDKAQIEAHKRYKKWYKNATAQDFQNTFGNRSHAFYKAIWERDTDEDIEEMRAKLNGEPPEPIMPENEFDAAGHDSGILGLSKQERRGKVCNDGTMGKLKDRQVGTLRVITSTFSATPGFTPFKPTMDADDKSQESPYKSANAPASIKKIKPTSAEMARFKEKTRRRESGYQPPRLNKSEAEGYQDNSLFKYSLNEQLNQVQLAGDIVEDVEVQAPKAKNAGFKRF